MTAIPITPIDRARLWIRRNPRMHRMVRSLFASTLLRLLIWYRERDSVRYDRWIDRNDTLSSADIAAIRAHIADLPARQTVSIVIPVDNPSAEHLRVSIASVQAQLWPEWELRICQNSTAPPHIGRVLAQASSLDSRIVCTVCDNSKGLNAACNDALRLATGKWIILLHPGDLLAPQALYEIGLAAAADATIQVIYADQDRIDEAGRRFDPWFKPDFDPDLLLAQNTIGPGGANRAYLSRAIGGFPRGSRGDPANYLALRAAAAAGAHAIHHISSILYRKRGTEGSGDALPPGGQPSPLAVRDYLNATGQSGCRPVRSASGAPRFVWPVPDPAPLVSIIVPTRDKAELLGPCVDGILNRTDYPAIELLIADNGSQEPETLALFDRWRGDPRVRIIPLPGPFNYSRINNQAVNLARGEIVLLLNNDTEVIGPDWLREMVSHAVRPGVAAVGAKLLYEDNTIQHAGVLLGIGWPYGVAGHVYCGRDRNDAGPFGLLSVVRAASAVTAACLAIRRDLFLEVGGFDERNLMVAFNDVDLCLRFCSAGYRNVWTPFAELFHKESASRGEDLEGEKLRRFQSEIDFMRSRWAKELDNDPFWNPNLSINSLQRILTHRIRREKSWSAYLRR